MYIYRNIFRNYRSWLEVANNEKRARGPSCIIRNKRKSRYMVFTWECLKQEIIECSTVKPSLTIFFTVGSEDPLSESTFVFRIPIHKLLFLKVF